MNVSRFHWIFPFALLGGWLIASSAFPADAGKNVPGFEIVYPPKETHLIFSHEKHKTLDCRTCHARIDDSEKTSDRNLPEEAACKTCHGSKTRENINDPGDIERCGFCHRDYDPTRASLPSRVYHPAANLNFGHRTHLQRMMDCKACHQEITSLKTASERDLPMEKTCLICHSREKDVKNRKGCTLCHVALPGGEIRTDFKGVRLVPQSGRLNHRRNWTKRHVEEARHQLSTCRECHQQHFCNSCHDGVMKPMKIHPEDYVTLHPIDARTNREHCTACHRYQSFCVDCHRKVGLTPEAIRKSSRTKIHPSGFGACYRTPDHHSFQAKRNLLACVSCHREADCTACHGANALCDGQPISVRIHGHLSSGQLERMKKANPRACRKCHEKLP